MTPRSKTPGKEVRRIALASLEAGEALPVARRARGLASPLRATYKYGLHLGNWTDGRSDGLLREAEATKPVSVLWMDNVKPDALDRLAPHLAPGCLLIYRPYFDPAGGATGANIQNYANTAKIRTGEYLSSPTIRAAYDSGRFIIKLFNETNIGGEGFSRGRAGFAPALEAWKTARAIVKVAFPLVKFMSIANTPGNDDVWFTGDATNMPYWYHGPEAAKPNPTAQEMQQAIISCPFREMFELCDYIGKHVYANLTRTVSGDLQTWYSRRHEQALRFLGPYIAAGKRMIISEWDMGYDTSQQARAVNCVYALANIVGPNPAIVAVNHWWNSDDGEGAATWEKHQTRKGGEFRPVVGAIKAFREGAEPGPVPPPPDPAPPPGDSIQLPAWCSVTRAVVPAGGRYWHLNRAYWQDSDTSGGTHHIYALNPHDATVEMVANIESTNVVIRARLDKPANEPAGNIAMWEENRYRAALEGGGVILSDSVSGMTMPQNQHVSYFLEWEQRTKASDPVPPTNTLTDRIAAALLAEFGDAFEDLRGKLPVHATLRYSPIDSRSFDYICIHHSATEKTRTWANIAGYHVNNNGWAGIAYHAGVRRGKFALFDSVDTERAHVYGMNHEAFGICVTGNYDTTVLDEMDIDVLKRGIKVIDAVYRHEKIIKGHNELRVGGFTECPGSDLKRVLPTLRVPPPPPAPTWTPEDAGKAAYFMEEMARAMRGDADARSRLIGALVNEPPRIGAHNVIVAVGLPPIYEERD